MLTGSTPGVMPPAAVTASCTRAPAGNRYTPGCRTLPATSTTSPAAAELDTAAELCRAGLERTGADASTVALTGIRCGRELSTQPPTSSATNAATEIIASRPPRPGLTRRAEAGQPPARQQIRYRSTLRTSLHPSDAR